MPVSVYMCVFYLYIYTSTYTCICLFVFLKIFIMISVSLCLPYLLMVPWGSTHTCTHTAHLHAISIHRNMCFFTHIFVYKEIRENKLGKELTPIMLLTQKKELCSFLTGGAVGGACCLRQTWLMTMRTCVSRVTCDTGGGKLRQHLGGLWGPDAEPRVKICMGTCTWLGNICSH